MVDVDGSSLPADSLAKSFGLVRGLAAIWRSVCIHQMYRLNSRNGLAMMTCTINIVISISISTKRPPSSFMKLAQVDRYVAE